MALLSVALITAYQPLSTQSALRWTFITQLTVGRSQDFYRWKILQKREDKGIMKGEERKERVWKVIFRDLYPNRKIKTFIIEPLERGTVSSYYRPRLHSAYCHVLGV